MSKKLISLFLVICILLPVFSACSDPDTQDGDSPSSNKTRASSSEITITVDDDCGITDEFIQSMNEALIMLLGSSNSYINGQLYTAVDGSAPATINDILYLPAAFVSEQLGAQTKWDDHSETLNVTHNETTLRITANADAFELNGKAVTLESSAILDRDVLLVPAEPLCSALDQPFQQTDDLIFIGEDFSETQTDIPEESLNLVYSSLRARLSPLAGLYDSAAQGKSYEEWVACTKSITIDPSLAPWSSAEDELAAVSGSLYIENINISATNQDNYNCSMTVYNYLGYTYGTVEVYNANDQLIMHRPVKPFSGLKDSVTQAICDVGILMNDIKKTVKHWDLDYMNYKSPLNSEIQDVEVTVPVGGYVIVSCNPMHSDYVAAYNAIHALVEISSIAGDLGALCADTGTTTSVKNLIKESLQGDLLQDATMVVTLAAEYRAFLTKIEGANWFNINSYAETACQALLDSFSRIGCDIFSLLEDSVKSAGQAVADFAAAQFLASVIPGSDAAFAGWKITTNASNLVCLFMDLVSVKNAQSLMLETCNWKAAYAEMLRNYDQSTADGNLRFVLGYINNDMVPELMIIDAVAHFGNTLEIYSFQNRAVTQLCDSSENTQMNIPNAMFCYVELEGIMIRADMNRGYSSLNYSELHGNAFEAIHSFDDDEGATGGSASTSYRYNNRNVAKWFYHWKQETLEEEYDDQIVYISGFTDGDELTESNISRVLE